MKKYLVALILVLAMAGSAFALGDINTNTNTFIPTNVNTPVNTNVNTNTNLNTFVPTNLNSNIQGQQQGQIQGQGQAQFSDVDVRNSNRQRQNQNNNQNIAPVQEVNTPQNLLSPPSQSVPFLYFGNGRIKDVTATMPNFAIYGIARYAGEPILDVVKTDANVKFKNYFKAVIDDARDLSGEKGFNSSQYRIMVFCAEAQKTWTTGGNLGGAGSGLSSTGLGGGSGAGSIIPQWGGTKADDLYTIFFVKIATPAKVSMDYQKEGWKKVEDKKPEEKKASAPAKKTVFGKEVSD